MKEKEFDDKIRDLVNSAVEIEAETVRCDEDVWFRIEGALIRGKRMMIFKAVSYVAVAASLVIGTFLIVPNEGDSSTIMLAEAETSKELVEESRGVSIEEEVIVQNIYSKVNVQDIQEGAKTHQKEGLYVKVEPSIQQSAPQSSVEDIQKESSAKEVQKETSKRRDTKKEYRTMSAQIGDIGESSYFAMTEEVKKSKRSIILSLSSNTTAGSSLSGNISSFPQLSPGSGSGSNYGIEPISTINNSLPISVGVQLQVGLGERFGVGIGANYTFLHSKYKATIDGSDQAIVDQSLHYIGLPLNVYYSILQNNSMKFYVSGGGMVEKGLQVNYKILDLNENSTHRNESITGLQWSVNVGLGFEYKIVNFVGIYIDPSLSYFFDGDQPYSTRSDQPLQFRVELGFRFHL